jgi:NAD(P)H dehydrogenase (quinone)
VLIGVTGATGGMGMRVARRLSSRGVAQRLIVRDAGRAPALAGAEVRGASSYGAFDEMSAALRGVDTLFLIPAKESADRLDQHRTAVDAAVAAGVSRIAYLSFVGARGSSFTLGREHGATEEHIVASGVPWTFPRMNLYMDFLPSMAGSDGVIRGPADGGRLAAVLRDDIADAVVELLTGEGDFAGQAYDLTGPEAFTLGEAAAEMSRASGKRISFVDETLGEARASRAVYGAPDWEVEAWISSYVAIAEDELSAVSGDVERLTGHPPVSLRDWLAAHPEALAHVR